MIVSHDRYFMDRLVDHLFVFEGNGEVRDFPGTYTQYRIWLKENEKKENKWQALEQQKSSGKTTEEVTQQHTVVENKNTNQTLTASNKRKPGFKEKREFEELEKEITTLEAEREQLTLEMSSSDTNYDTLEKISKRLLAITAELEIKELRWLELSELM
jgi:ATP-binding cassette subfamily F protein uup